MRSNPMMILGGAVGMAMAMDPLRGRTYSINPPDPFARLNPPRVLSYEEAKAALRPTAEDIRRDEAAKAKRARRAAKLRAEMARLEPDLHFRCAGCGKDEIVSRAAYESGDSGWYFDEGDGFAVCGGSQWCLP